MIADNNVGDFAADVHERMPHRSLMHLSREERELVKMSRDLASETDGKGARPKIYKQEEIEMAAAAQEMAGCAADERQVEETQLRIVKEMTAREKNDQIATSHENYLRVQKAHLEQLKREAREAEIAARRHLHLTQEDVDRLRALAPGAVGGEVSSSPPGQLKPFHPLKTGESPTPTPKLMSSPPPPRHNSLSPKHLHPSYSQT